MVDLIVALSTFQTKKTRWDSLTTEFFDDEAVLKISCYLDTDGLKHFGVGLTFND